MSKKVQILFLIVFLIQFWFPVSTVLALDSCLSRTIECKPNFFPQRSTEYKLECSIQNEVVFNNLKGNSIRLLFDRDPVFRGGTFTNDVNVQSKEALKFNLTGGLISRATHQGVLQWFPPKGTDYIDFCEGISYQIGAAGSCRISAPSAIPPGSSLTVKFAGIADTLYHLVIRISSAPGRATTLETTTDNQGQGIFPQTTVTGGSGNIVSLEVRPINVSGIDPDRAACKTEVRLDPSVTAPPPPDTTPVQPVLEPVVRKCGDKDEHGNEIVCAKGGGQEAPGCTDAKYPNGSPNPGIATAIGCIHTNPAELTKDILKFAIGIGGGLAFLMMILGAYQMLTSAGNPDSLKAGSDRLTNAIIGLLIVIFSVLLMQIIGVGILNIPGFEK